MELTYTSEEVGRHIRLTVGDIDVELTLDGGEPVQLKPYLSLDSLHMGRMRGGTFDPAVSLQRVQEWSEVAEGTMMIPSQPFVNYLWRTVLDVRKDSRFILDVTAGNGVEVLVDGRTMLKHLNPYRTVCRTEKVLVDLPEGVHEVVVRSYNRFESCVWGGVELSDCQRIYKMVVPLPHSLGRGAVQVKVSSYDVSSEHTDCGLHNLRLRFLK